MRDLSHILANEMKINVLAERFGFSNQVSILASGWYPHVKAIALSLVVQEIPGRSDVSRCSNLLATKLSEVLQCKVMILALEKKPYNSALLSDEVAVCRLFGVGSPDEVKLKDLNREVPHYAEHLMQAEQYLMENALLLDAEESPGKRLKFGSNSP